MTIIRNDPIQQVLTYAVAGMSVISIPTEPA